MQAVRERVKRLENDRYLADDIARVKEMVMKRDIILALEDDDLLPLL